MRLLKNCALTSRSTPVYEFETFEKRPLLTNFCVPDNRDLSTGSDFNPQNTQCILPVKIFAFLELE
jgi:hypothetical protein